jgi:serine/threonine-protein kinase
MALSQIRHSNVVTIENGGLTDKGEVFIAMEFLQGHTLRDVLVERGKLPIREALSIVIQISLGVGAAHEVNVVHRDLKPENIFCTSDGAVKVLDLGLAKFIGYDLKETDPAKTGMIGTAAYIAPERLDGLPIDARCDIYALGLIAYECIAGFHPLVPDGVWPSSEEIALRQLTFDPPALRHLPADVWGAIARAMHKDRERRFATMDQFAATLHGIRDGLSTNDVPSPRPSGAPASRPRSAPASAVASAGSAVSLEAQVVPRVPAMDPASARPSIVETVLRYPVMAGAVIGLVGAFGLFFWRRSHHAPSGAAGTSVAHAAAAVPAPMPAPPLVTPSVAAASANALAPMRTPPTPAPPAVTTSPAPSAAPSPVAAPAAPAPVPPPEPAAPPATAVAPAPSAAASTHTPPHPAASSKPARRLTLPSSGL